ncbi:MAG: hypothetical protein LBN21_03680 [Treponema sp.]|jgi:hypothetical protein|nr:hypothetical protein [Treponema sp.]
MKLNKKYFITIILIISISLGIGGHLFAQETQSNSWNGTVRFNPAALVLGLVLGLPEIEATITPFVNDNIGIPINVDLVFANGIFGIGLQTGIEGIFLQRIRDKQGLYFNVMVGGMYLSVLNYPVFAFTSETNIGYQLVTNGGFVFTPAGGIKYNTYTGIGFSLMLDIGFAY